MSYNANNVFEQILIEGLGQPKGREVKDGNVLLHWDEFYFKILPSNSYGRVMEMHLDDPEIPRIDLTLGDVNFISDAATLAGIRDRILQEQNLHHQNLNHQTSTMNAWFPFFEVRQGFFKPSLMLKSETTGIRASYSKNLSDTGHSLKFSIDRATSHHACPLQCEIRLLDPSYNDVWRAQMECVSHQEAQDWFRDALQAAREALTQLFTMP